jgi:hypothetical protein
MSEPFEVVAIDQALTKRVTGYWGANEKGDDATELARVVRAGDISPEGHLLGYAERWMKPREVEKARCSPDDVLITASGNGLGKAYLVRSGDEVTSSNFTRRLVPDLTRALGGYLHLALQSEQGAAKLREHTATSAFPNLKPTFFADPWLPLPPLSVQRRIVDLMANFDTHLANLRAEQEAARAGGASLRHATFAILVDRGKRPAGEMFQMLLGRQKSARQSVGDHVIPYLRAANIADSGLKLGDVLTMNFSPQEQARYCLEDDDILVVEGGTFGLAVRWRGEVAGPVGFDKHVIRLRAVQGSSTSEYGLQWAKWARETGAFEEQATGITIRALGFGRASAMPVPDITVDEQAALFEPLAALDALVDRLRVEDRTLVALRAGLLGALLSGKSVLPDSYDALIQEVA